MLKHPRVTEGRINNLIRRVHGMIYVKKAPLSVQAYPVSGEPIPAETVLGEKFEPFSVGDAWGEPWGTTWFRFSGRIPPEWKGEEVVALVGLGFKAREGFTTEGLVWRDGVPVGAINVNRREVPLAQSANGGEQLEFYVEAAANPCVPGSPDYDAAEAATAAAERKPQFRLEQAELACFDRDAFELYHDLLVANATMLSLPAAQEEASEGASGSGRAGGPRRGQLLYALNVAANVFDENDRASFAAGREALRDVLARHNGDTAHQISAVGHAHIDTAWLWPLRESIRKCGRTFSSQLALMESYPEHIFACSQPQQYAWAKAFYPALYDRMRSAVERGQWELAGSMWVEPDCNLVSGESLVRQLLHGRNFLLDEFGCETRVAWLPDVFGYCASLPQILKKSGVDYFLTQKLSWNQFNPFPHHTFLWEGIDGTGVFAHYLPAGTYNGDFDPEELAASARNFREHDRATRSLYAFGFGDGGGGPTRTMLEIARRVIDLEGLPKVAIEKVETFFAAAEAEARDLPVWVGELYLERHRGTYTTQARNKKGNRKSEILLRDAEFFDVASGGDFSVEAGVGEANRSVHDVFGKNATTPAGYLDRAWKLLLLNQFHDILPGSSIMWVYGDSGRDYAKIAKLSRAVAEPARKSLAEKIDTSGTQTPFIVFNTTGFARTEIISLPDGAPIRVDAPPCGYVVVDAGEQRPVASYARPVEVSERERLVALDNGMLRIIFDRDGLIRAIRDHRVRREVLASGERGNVFQLHPDYPNAWDAWDVDIFYREKCEDIVALESMDLVESTPLRGTLRIVRRFGRGSTVSQRISLTAGSPRIDFETEVDWQEEHRFLKVAFPLNVRSARATYEIPFGHIERPTHYNTSWDLAQFEVPAQRWADLSEGDYGVALLNDCKYGYDIFGNVMRLSLLRAPTAPDPTADRGRHQFTYSLLPHTGDFRDGRVIEHATALNIPLQVVPSEVREGSLPRNRSFFQVDRPALVVETIKRAERENAVIIRLYESQGTRGHATLTTTLPVKTAFMADLMERTLQTLEAGNGEIALSYTPFEIITLKLLLE